MSSTSSSSNSGTWVINVDKYNKYVGGLSLWSHRCKYIRCIYKIPEHIAGSNPKLYQHQLVSLGPYNYQLKSEQKDRPAMEIKKTEALNSFTSRTNAKLTDYCQILRPQLEYFIYPYDRNVISKKFNSTKFVGKSGYSEFIEMMIMDGCFIIEVLRENRELFSRQANKYVLPLIKQDMLLLENQVPFWLLEYLLSSNDARQGKAYSPLPKYEVGDQTGSTVALLDLIIKCYSLPESTRRIKPPYLHILDIHRRGLISQDFPRENRRIKDKFINYFHEDAVVYKHKQTVQNFPSASKLYQAGIPFKKSVTGNLKYVSYRHGTLQLPPFVINQHTESTLANLMAFEKLHNDAESEVTSYVFVLNCLIHNARDVNLLKSRDIIQHEFHDNEDVVKLFGLIGKDVVAPHDNILHELYTVSNQLRRRRVRKRLNIWRLDLLEKYFNTPWGALSVIAAILLFTLSTIQTVYSVLSYIHRNK